jgi:galactose oxidase
MRLRPVKWAATLLIAAAAAACDSSVKPEPPGQDTELIRAAYVCGNDFDVESDIDTALSVHYRVLGTSEAGDLLLPARTTATPVSTTRLTTIQTGTLQLSVADDEAAPAPNTGIACPRPADLMEPQASEGEWSFPFAWPVVAVHLHLLPTADVLSWGKIGDPQIWNPPTGAFSPALSSTMLFCSGHAFLPDGRLLVTGGHIEDHHGLPDANIFDPGAQAWTSIPAMVRGRWYPTNTTLADGQILTLAGRDQEGLEVEIPEVWTGTTWRPLPGAARELPYYPRAFVAPSGLVFYAGELQQSAYLDPSGEGQWLPAARSNYGRRDYGSAVMYDGGKVMIVGGSDPPDGVPTNTAEIIDLSGATPEWSYTGSMNYPRRQFNTTLLPDGGVLATGGTSAEGFSDPFGSVHAAEVWNPLRGEWTVLASNQVDRVYHSTTLLLPDGRVLHTGSGDGPNLPRELNAELFSPPYLFRGRRPAIREAPEAVTYGEQFLVQTAEAPRIVRATLVRLGSVTHGFDQNGRFLELALARVAGGLMLTAPASGTLAPPGDYLLFLLTSAGVPSVGKIIRIR